MSLFKKKDTSKEIQLEDYETTNRNLRGWLAGFVMVLGILYPLFHLYTGGVEPMNAYQQRVVHLAFAMALVFLLVPPAKRLVDNKAAFYLDFLFCLISIAIGFYGYTQYFELVSRVGMPNTTDLVFGVLLIILLIEATRRMTGIFLSLIAVVFLIYAFIGPYLPGLLGHNGYSFERIVNQMFLTNEGIYGITLGVSASYVFLFIMFGTFLEITGAGKLFLELSLAVVGRMTGGPAKVAVVGSSLFGMVSGSAAANVAGTGQVTIPLMKRVGYKAKFAGAVESVASTGGQLMPPIMGAAAFIMVDVLRLPYTTIILAAIMPAFLYYFSTIYMVHLRSKKRGLKGLKKEELPDLKETLKEGYHLFIPFVLLLVLLTVFMLPPVISVFWSMVALLVVAQLRKSTRMSLKQLAEGLVLSSKNALLVAIVCAVAGIVIGVINLTGLGLNLSSLMVQLAGGQLLVLLLLTMGASIILGMGLPTTATYVILSALIAPAIINLGVEPLSAHFFVFYFGVLSAITPPVAVASFVASGIAKSPPMTTAVESVKLGLVAFLVPFMFIYGPELMMIGTAGEIIPVIISSIVGVTALSIAIEGYFVNHAHWIERIILAISALLLLETSLWSDFVAYPVVIITLALHWIRYKNNNQQELPVETENVSQ